MKKSRLAGWNGLDERVEYHTFYVRCTVCNARGGAAGGKVLLSQHPELALPEWATDDEALKERAINAWNRWNEQWRT